MKTPLRINWPAEDGAYREARTVLDWPGRPLVLVEISLQDGSKTTRLVWLEPGLEEVPGV